MGPNGCQWCRVLAGQPSVMFAEPMFVVLTPSAGSSGHRLTLVPTLHVATLTDMSQEDMASFLAGLSKLVRWLKEEKGANVVELRPGRPRGDGDGKDQHFYLSVRTR